VARRQTEATANTGGWMMWKYAVQIEIEKGEYMLVRNKNPFTNNDDVLYFRDREKAEQEALRWNTGAVIKEQENDDG
jgi:hypothetical protein